MKNSIALSVLKSVVLVTFISLAFSSCSNDDDEKEETPEVSFSELPSNLIGTYSGALSYTNSDGSVTIGTENGTATIASVGPKTYKVTFSDDVPEITNLKFTTEASGNFASVATDGSVAGLVLKASSMELGVTTGGNTWAFTGSK